MGLLFWIGLVMPILVYSSTSVIENEHSAWHFTSQTFLSLLFATIFVVTFAGGRCRSVINAVKINTALLKLLLLVTWLSVLLRVSRSRNEIINFSRLNQLERIGDEMGDANMAIKDNTISVASSERILHEFAQALKVINIGGMMDFNWQLILDLSCLM